jgi:hypothetical protein
MTAEQQRIRIAEALGVQTEGWWCPHCEREVAPAFVTFQETHDPHSEGCGRPVEGMPIPDYPNSLDACATFEAWLRDHPDREHDYGIALARLSIGEEFEEDGFMPNGWGYFAVAHATAQQRCDAFCAVMGIID